MLSNTAKSNLYTMGISSRNDPRQAVPAAPCIPAADVRLLRARLIMEEALETIEALGFSVDIDGEYPGDGMDRITFVPMGIPNLEKIIDGCCDVQYVTVGTLVACGVPDEPHMDEVNFANDNKFPDGKAVTDANGKFQKPAGWKPPDHQRVLDECAAIGCDLRGASEEVIREHITTAGMHKELESHNVVSIPKGIVVGPPPWAYWAPEDPRWAGLPDSERDKWYPPIPTQEGLPSIGDTPGATYRKSSLVPNTRSPRTCPGCGCVLHTMEICPTCAVQKRIAGELPPHPTNVGKIRFFVQDVESGEPKYYAGDEDNLDEAKRSIMHIAEYAFDMLANDPSEEHTFVVSAVRMTDAEVKALPEL